MSLADLQKMLADALVRPASITAEPAWVDTASRTLTGSARMAPVQQLDVYREQFWWRHVACVVEDYPALAALVGEKELETLVAEYVRQNPPTDFLLRNLGAGLAAFLADARPNDPLLADLARTEWAFIDAFDAADAPPLDPTTVAAVPEDAWPMARITLHPSLQRVRLMHPAHEVRNAFHAGEKTLERPAATPTFLVVFRRDMKLFQETMDALAFGMLERLAHGQHLGEAGDGLAAESGQAEEVEARIGEWFTRWASLGWISTVSVASREGGS